MSNPQKEDNKYLDAKSIPKFQFQIMNDQLVNCIKQLYYQSKSQQKIINVHKKEIQQKLNQQQLIDALQCIQANLFMPSQLTVLLTGGSVTKTVNNKSQYNDPNNLVMTNSIHLGSKLSQITEILSIFNNKLTQLDKKVTQTQQKLNLNVKQKITSVEQQLTQFIKQYRAGFMDMNKRVQQAKTFCEVKAKDVEMNTLWKITQCAKRMQERPTVDMVKDSISQMEHKLMKMAQSSNGGIKIAGTSDTVKIQQDIIKLKKLIDFTTIETQSQIKSLGDKIQHNYMTLKQFAQEKLDITKNIQNLSISQAEHGRKIISMQSKLTQTLDKQYDMSSVIDDHNQLLKQLNRKMENFTKSDEMAKILSQIDPHEICRMSSQIKSLQNKMNASQQRISSLNTFTQALRSKMQFWNAPNKQNPQRHQDSLNIQLMTKIIKQQINNSDFRLKVTKHQQQILDLSSLKQGLNDIIKKLGRLNKDNDLTNLKYEIQGVQQYAKKQLLILSNRLFSLENMMNQTKRRPLSARTKDDGKMFVSMSTKKLVPANCISCHPNTPMSLQKQRQRRTVFNSKLLFK